MKLVKRDLMFLSDLYFIKYINSKRVGSLFGNYQSAMRRIKILQQGLFVRHVDHMIYGERVYCLARKGFSIINQNPYPINKTDKINHSLYCADFYFYLKNQGHTINYFAVEEEITFKHNGKKCKFRPDIIVETDRWYLVEIDLSNRRIEEKVRKWEDYYNSLEFKLRFELFPPIIIISNNLSKVQEIIDKHKTIELNYAYKDIENIKWIYKY